MEDTQNMSMETAAEEELLFDADEDLFADEDGNQTEGSEETAEEAPAEPSDEAKNGEEAEAPAAAPTADDEKFDLKHLKGIRTVNRAEVVELAQQGLDYQRVAGQRDALRNALQEQTNWRTQNEELLGTLAEVAKASNMDVPAFVRSLRENQYVKEGLSRDAAKERMEREHLQRQLDARNQAEAQRQQATFQQTRAQREIRAFCEKYPDVDVKTIPKEVFQEAASGKTTLVGAYVSHLNSQLKAENERLQNELTAQKQNTENRKKSVGSVRTEGSGGKLDDFLSGFNGD